MVQEEGLIIYYLEDSRKALNHGELAALSSQEPGRPWRTLSFWGTTCAIY